MDALVVLPDWRDAKPFASDCLKAASPPPIKESQLIKPHLCVANSWFKPQRAIQKARDKDAQFVLIRRREVLRRDWHTLLA
jgi:hypothetical protein